jgi:Flp pilus assembly protein TadG
MNVPPLMSRLRRLARDERGAVVVEFALILPLFLIVVFAVMEFARGYQALNAVTTAAREGARLAAVEEFPESPETFALVKDRAKTIAGSMFTTDTIVVSQPTCDIAVPDCKVVTVSTSMVMTGVTPILAMFGKPDGLPLSATATFRWERVSSGGGGGGGAP